MFEAKYIARETLEKSLVDCLYSFSSFGLTRSSTVSVYQVFEKRPDSVLIISVWSFSG